MGIKKRGTLFLSLYEVRELPNHQIREAHDITRERLPLIFLVIFMKFSRFHTTKYKQKRYFMSLKFT